MSYNNGTYGGNNPMLGNDLPAENVTYDDDEDTVEVEEEQEVTDDDAGSEDMSSAVNVDTEKAASPTPEAKRQGYGKVTPSAQVANMKMSSPVSRPKGPMFAPGRYPFPTFGGWNAESLDLIKIEFPSLAGKDETTNELTRSTRPEARYWKGDIIFKYGSFTSETLRVDNVHIPHCTGKGYGSKYAYLCLPTDLRTAFSDASAQRSPTKVEENSLVPDRNRWFKIANKVENSFGIIDKRTMKFHPKSLETIFDATSCGISCCAILRFEYKAATTDSEPLRPTTIRTISVVVERAYIREVGLNVQMPTRVSKEKTRHELVADRSDVATDDLLQKLRNLGI